MLFSKSKKRLLFKHCINGNNEDVIELLAQGADVNKKDEKGYGPLHYASQESHEAIVQTLFNNFADVNETTDKSDTPLHLACVSSRSSKGINKISETTAPLHLQLAKCDCSRENIIELLIECGANIDEKNKNESTPLHYAVKKRKKAIVQLLLQRGANANEKVQEGKPPLEYADGCIKHLFLVEQPMNDAKPRNIVVQIDDGPNFNPRTGGNGSNYRDPRKISNPKLSCDHFTENDIKSPVDEIETDDTHPRNACENRNIFTIPSQFNRDIKNNKIKDDTPRGKKKTAPVPTR